MEYEHTKSFYYGSNKLALCTLLTTCDAVVTRLIPIQSFRSTRRGKRTGSGSGKAGDTNTITTQLGLSEAPFSRPEEVFVL